MVALASDWHVEEYVPASKSLGKNSYDLATASKRMHNYFDGICWLANHHRNSFSIDELVLWLGGDFISGYIHEELKETNLLSPVEAILFAAKHIKAGVEQLNKVIKVTCVCNFGNHGRTTDKTQIQTAAENSYEWLMYHMLSQSLPDNKFLIADTHYIYLDIGDYRIRFGHGDMFKSYASIPRSIAALQLNSPADLTCFGHYHMYQSTSSWVSNGSLIGFSPYSHANGYHAEIPQQASFLVDKRRGKCLDTPIWVNDRQ